MNSRNWLSAAALLALSCSVASAQGLVGANFSGHADNPVGPTVSPYLNLLQTNNQGIIPYQTLVRPQIDARNAFQRQGAAISQLQQQVFTSPGGGSGPRATGHPTVFMNFSHFYPAKR